MTEPTPTPTPTTTTTTTTNTNIIIINIIIMFLQPTSETSFISTIPQAMGNVEQNICTIHNLNFLWLMKFITRMKDGDKEQALISHILMI
jgi:hypothetical protein